MMRLAAAGLAGAIAVAGLMFSSPASADIKIGVIYDHTGAFAAGGSKAAAIGNKIAIDMVNEKGGVAGHKIIPIEAGVLERAEEPFPTLLGSLDALHLATALLTRSQVPELLFATHDGGLATAARAVGFSVLGSPALRGG